MKTKATTAATKSNLDSSFEGASRRAMASAVRYQCAYYVRPTLDGKQYCVTDVRPQEFTAKAEPNLHDPRKADLRNMENWPLPLPAAVA